ncbi:MAG: cupin, partial [Burkholderiales bacterium PBB4]
MHPPTNPSSAITAVEAQPRVKPSNFPEPFAARMRGRTIRPLGEVFGLRNFG